MTIADLRSRSKELLGRIPKDALLVAIFLISCSASFGLGILTEREQGKGSAFAAPEAAKAAPAAAVAAVATSSPSGGAVLASRNGTRYYFPQCSGASRISEANKVWFASEAEAKAKGYTLASGCRQ